MEMGNSLAHFAAGIGAGLAVIGGAAPIPAAKCASEFPISMPRSSFNV